MFPFSNHTQPLRKKGFYSFIKTPRGRWAGTYLQPLGVLQGYFKPEKPSKVLATLKNLWRILKGCKYVPIQQPRGFFEKLEIRTIFSKECTSAGGGNRNVSQPVPERWRIRSRVPKFTLNKANTGMLLILDSISSRFKVRVEYCRREKPPRGECMLLQEG
jgi:hypothetical protein